MYGTVARFKVKSGHFDDLVGLMHEWDRDRKPQVKGAVAGFIYRLDEDRDEAILVAVFKDRDSYKANADDPEQDKFFQRMREHFASDAEWNDGEIVYADI